MQGQPLRATVSLTPATRTSISERTNEPRGPESGNLTLERGNAMLATLRFVAGFASTVGNAILLWTVLGHDLLLLAGCAIILFASCLNLLDLLLGRKVEKRAKGG